MSNFVGDGTLFNASFADTSQQTSSEGGVHESALQVAVFVAPTGVNVTVAIQVQDVEGVWHSVQSATTNDGVCDCTAVPNPRKVRALITPSAGSGSAKVWIRIGG